MVGFHFHYRGVYKAMLASFFTLGLTPDATDKTIRKRYLELIKRHTPENDPERFQEITQAYESIKTPRARVYSVLYGNLNQKDPEAALTKLCQSHAPNRRIATLTELLQANKGS